MNKRHREKLERLYRDLPALARHLGFPDEPQWQHKQAHLDGLEATVAGREDAEDRANLLKFVEAARWKAAEEMLRLADFVECEERRESDIRSGKIKKVFATIGLPWKPNTRIVRVDLEMKWHNHLSDLFEHPAVRGAMPAPLHAIIRSVLVAFLAERKELDELRTNPDPARIKAWQAQNDSDGVPAAMQPILARLEAYAEQRWREAKAETGRPGAEVKKANDPKQAAKAKAKDLWNAWQKGTVSFNSIAAWARECCDRFDLLDHKNVEGWHRTWKKEASGPAPNGKRKK